MRSRRRENAVRSFGPGGDGFGPQPSRGTGGRYWRWRAPGVAGSGLGRPFGRRRPGKSGRAALRYAFLYGTPDLDPAPGGSLVAAMFPASRAASPLTPVPVAIKLAAAPVSSPDQAVTALATVDMVHDGAKITLTLLDAHLGCCRPAGVGDCDWRPARCERSRDAGFRSWLRRLFPWSWPLRCPWANAWYARRTRVRAAE